MGFLIKLGGKELKEIQFYLQLAVTLYEPVSQTLFANGKWE